MPSLLMCHFAPTCCCAQVLKGLQVPLTFTARHQELGQVDWADFDAGRFWQGDE